jgi:ABC-type transport system substrate-binding protein
MLACVFLGVSTAHVWAAGGTLKATMSNDLKYVDPFWTTAYVTRNHGYMIYDTLFALDANLQPQPQMVETWQVSPDGLTYTFTLRPGLKWHDGTPVRAADCYDSVPFVLPGQYFTIRAYRKNIQGVIASPVPFFWNSAKE